MGRRKVRAVHGPERVTRPWVESILRVGATLEGDTSQRSTLLVDSPVHTGFGVRLIFDWLPKAERPFEPVEEAKVSAYGHKPDGSTTTLEWWQGSALAVGWLLRDDDRLPDDPRAKRERVTELAGLTIARLHLWVLRVDVADKRAVVRGYDWDGPAWLACDPRSFAPLEDHGVGCPHPETIGGEVAYDEPRDGPRSDRGPSWGDDPNAYREGGKRSPVGR